MTRTGRASTERGFTIVIVSLVLITMLIFAALVIDLGQVYVERRNDQNSADASATSGAVQLLITGDLQDSVDEILAKVNDDLGRSVPAAEWTGCADSDALARTAADLSLTPATDCISFSSTFSTMRVRVPDQSIRTTFANVIGIDEFTSSAFAEVSIHTNGGGALPFVVLAVNGPGDQICLRTNDTPREPPDQPAVAPYQPDREADPCNEDAFHRASGGRGTLLPYAYEDCSQRGNKSMVDAVISGFDHPLGVFDPELPPLATGDDADLLDEHPNARIDGDDRRRCTVALPNSIAVDTGLSAQDLQCALVRDACGSGYFTDGMPGRLHEAGTGASFNGYAINDTALWEYLVDSMPATAPASCSVARVSSTPFYTRRAAMLDCLQNWTSGEIFVDEISEDPRFGYVPRVAENALCAIQPAPGDPCVGALPKHVHVNNFSPIYIDGLYEHGAAVCDAANPAFIPAPTGPDLWAIHYPGQDSDCGSTGGGSKVDRVSGIVLPCGALPREVCDPSRNPPFPGPEGIFRVRLTR